MRFAILLLISVFILLLGCAPTIKNQLADSQGRITIYHGVAVSNFSKYNPGGDFLPWQSASDYARLNGWGFNLVRYQVYWNAAEPTRNNYDDSYFQKSIAQVQELEKLNVDVLIDLHGDLYGPKFCAGDGFPVWAAYDDKIPFVCQQPWTANLLQPAIVACYRNFWDSTSLQDKYVQYVKKCFDAFDTMSNVVGFDIMNEPFPGLPDSVIKLTQKLNLHDFGLAKETAADLLRFETKVVPALYDKVKVATSGYKKPIWFQPAIWTSSGIPTLLNWKPSPHAIYAPHYYAVPIHESKPYTKEIKELTSIEFKELALEANNFKTPVVLAEFGAPMQAQGYLDYLGDLLNTTDQYGMGWVYYTFDKGHPFGILDDNGVETPHMTKLVRVYPQKIAGVNPKYSISGNTFTLTYNHTLNANTEIFIPSSLKTTVKVNGVVFPYTSGILKYNKLGQTTIVVQW